MIEDRIAGLEGIEKITSRSVDERSNITVEFSVDRDVDSAANDIRDRVSRVANALPEEADAPEIAKADSGADPVMFLNLNADNMSALELTDYAERYVVDQLATVPGRGPRGRRWRPPLRDAHLAGSSRRSPRATSPWRTSRARFVARTCSFRPVASNPRRASSRCARRSASTPRTTSARS